MTYGSWKALAVVAGACAALTLPAAFRDEGARSSGAAAAALAPQDAKKPPAAPAPAPSPWPVVDDGGPVVVLSGNEQGFIRPCGCSKPKLGGIDRRGHALAKLREKNPDIAAVSVGGLLAEGGRQQELKLDAFLMAMSVMDYVAWVPGAGDFRIGAQALFERKSMASFPFVLANARVGADGAFESRVKLGRSGGMLIGLIEPMAPETGVTVTPAAEALAREIAFCADAAFILVVYNGPETHVEAIAAVVPEALRSKTVFAVPGHADAPTDTGKPAHGMPILAAGGKGRALGVLKPGRKPLFDLLVLEEKMPTEATTAEILAAYKQFVRDENLVTRVNRVAAPASYVGDEKCIRCHAQAHEDLVDTKHQKAFQTLVDSQDERDPECVKCHVTGWGVEGGYVDKDVTPERKNVNCEHCHGPASEHVTKLVKTVAGKVTKDTCLKCHDPDNSPQFDFKTYWPKIIHR